MTTITHKRGTTFRARLVFDADVEMLTAATFKSEVRLRWWSDTMHCRLLDDNPRVVEVSALDTSGWPPSLLAFDLIVIGQNGEIVATETHHINCVLEVTE